MRWLAIFIAVVAGACLFGQRAVADSSAPALIESIAFDSQAPGIDKISFQLSQFVEPEIFIIGGDKPRLVLDFLESKYSGENVITVSNGNLARRIRVGLHQTPVLKTRVVIDLLKAAKVRYSHTYSELDNTLVVLLAPPPSEPLPKNGGQQSPPVTAHPEEQQQPEGQRAAATPPDGEKSATKADDLEAAPVEQASSELEPAEQPVEMAKEEGGKGEWAPRAASPQLLDISFDNSSNTGEMVLFHLNDFYPPTVSAIEKENPRVICDFMHMGLAEGVPESIAAGGKFVKQIRAEKHVNPEKVRITLDLSPDRDYDLQQVFFKNDNLFVLIVNELPEKKAIE
ncbi:MAG: AMIN domain-containing protein [Desulforhopalus sp.]